MGTLYVQSHTNLMYVRICAYYLSHYVSIMIDSNIFKHSRTNSNIKEFKRSLN